MDLGMFFLIVSNGGREVVEFEKECERSSVEETLYHLEYRMWEGEETYTCNMFLSWAYFQYPPTKPTNLYTTYGMSNRSLYTRLIVVRV